EARTCHRRKPLSDMPAKSQPENLSQSVSILSSSGQLWDQSRAALAGEIRPKPLALDAQTVLQLRGGEDGDEGPHQIREEAARMQSAPFEYRVILADDGHVALIEIAERMYDLLPLEVFRDQPPDIPPFLNRRLRHAGYRMFILRDRGRVANHEYSRRAHDL